MMGGLKQQHAARPVGPERGTVPADRFDLHLIDTICIQLSLFFKSQPFSQSVARQCEHREWLNWKIDSTPIFHL